MFEIVSTSRLGLAVGSDHAASQAQGEAASARENAASTLSAGAGVIAVVLRDARAEIARLTDALAVKMAQAEGLTKMAKAYAEVHPDSPLRTDSGKRFKDGRGKLKIRLVYEAAFDAYAAKLGIAKPASRRAD